MNIVFIFGSYPYSDSITYDGGADYLRNLAEKLASKEHNVFIITSGSANSNIDIPISINRVNIFPIIFEWGLKGFVTGEYKKISLLLKRINPEVINVIYPDSHLKNKYVIPLFIKLFNNKTPIITTLFHFLPKGANLFYMLETIFLYLTSTKLHFHDEGFKAIFDKFFFPLRRKSFFIPVGCNIKIPEDIEELKKNKLDLKEKLVLEPSAKYISFFGYWYPSKGIDLLIKALHILVLKGINLKLLLIGGHSIEEMNEYEKGIINLINEWYLSDRVIITGYCSDDTVVNYMLCSEACVFPFRSNMIGRSSIMLPIALRLPIITTRLVKKPSFLVDRETALLVSPNDPEELANVIEEILMNETIRDYVSKNISQLAIKIEWDNIANEWVSLLSQITKSP